MVLGWEEESFPICCMIWRCGKESKTVVQSISCRIIIIIIIIIIITIYTEKGSVVEADGSGGSHIVR